MLTVYPALKWFDADGTAEPYESGRDLDSLTALYVVNYSLLSDYTNLLELPSITQKSKVKSNIKPPPPPQTLVLDAQTFDQVALVRYCSHLVYIVTYNQYLQDDTKNVLVSFTVRQEISSNLSSAHLFGLGSLVWPLQNSETYL